VKLHTTLLSSIVALSTGLSLNAAVINYGSLETFNNLTPAEFTEFVSTSNWENTDIGNDTSRGQDDGVGGNDMAGTGNDTLRIRGANGEITFVPALTLVTDNAASLTVELDYQGRNNGNILGLEYSALGDFSDLVTFGAINNSAPNTTIVLAQTYTATNGSGGITFTDTASIRIHVVGGSTANPSGTFVDNISVTATAIPEPSSAVLLGLTSLALILRRRRA